MVREETTSRRGRSGSLGGGRTIVGDTDDTESMLIDYQRKKNHYFFPFSLNNFWGFDFFFFFFSNISWKNWDEFSAC